MASVGLQQTQKQSQNIVLAPQLRHSLKILQVPAMELRSTILEELQTNPMLEEGAMDTPSLEAQYEDDSPPEVEESAKELDFDDNYDIFTKLEKDWRDYFAQENAQQQYTEDDANRRQHFFDSVVSETSLQEHLIDQARQAELSTLEFRAMEYLIGSLDKKGYLEPSVSDLALMSRLPLSVVQSAYDTLRQFDPIGIGSANLQDCLLFQLKQKGREGSLAWQILKNHYDLLLRRRIPELSRKLSETVPSVTSAINEISALNPNPIAAFSEDQNRIVEPDVTVRYSKDKADWVITLNNDYIPRLRINSSYKELLAKGSLTAKDKNYLIEKMRAGKFLINSISQRQQTIERITGEILKFQRGFFEEGVSKLRPLTMNHVAESIGVHETTVSRAIANKFIDTPWGVFPFKYFFKPGYKGQDGESVSNTSIKEMIQQLVDEEDPAKPFSDQEIVRRLGGKGIKIARRTVAKYREELGILPTNLRRSYG